MSVLLDTNILTRLAQQSHPQHAVAEAATTALRRAGQELCIVPQNLYEFWAVCTRPIAVANGLGLSIDQTRLEFNRARSLFTFKPDTPAIFIEWEQLVAQYAVSGKNAHDARLVAAMIVHGIDRLLTFNSADFKRYAMITILEPDKLR